MSSNSNLGYTGYLLRKTIQPYSLRQENSNFNEFKEKNMIMYINKKVSNTREREGNHLSHQQLQNGIHLPSRSSSQYAAKNDEGPPVTEEMELNLEKLKRDEEKEKQDPFYLEVVQQMKQNEYTDDFAVVSQANRIVKQSKLKKERSDIQQTLNNLIANQIDQSKIQELFRDYKKISLKDKLNELKSRHVDMAKIQKKIKKDQQKLQDLEDTEKVNKIMGRICSSKNMTIGSILSLNEQDIKYVNNDNNLENIPKIKALELLQELMEDQETENQKNMIRIFKKTQIDNLDADGARNKFNMTSYKKKNEQTEKVYQEMAQTNKKNLLNALKDPYLDPDRFIRKKDGVKAQSEQANAFSRLISTKNTIDQQSQQPYTPKKIPLGDILTQQEKYHEKIKDIYLKNRNNLSAPNMNNQKIIVKNSSRKNSQDKSASHIFITTQNNYSVPSSTFNKTAKPNQLQNISSNSQINTPQKNRNLSPMSTDQKTNFTNQFHLHRTHSAKQSPNISDFAFRISSTKSQNNSSNQKIQYRAPTKQFELFDKIQSEKQNKFDQLRDRIVKLKENNLQSKAKKLQMLVDKLEMKEIFQHFVNDCNTKTIESNKETAFTKEEIKNLEDQLDDELKDINLLQQGSVNIETKVDNPNFIEFKNRAEFKRKLINYLIQNVEKQTDILSKYKTKQFTQNFLQKLLDKDAINNEQ